MFTLFKYWRDSSLFPFIRKCIFADRSVKKQTTKSGLEKDFTVFVASCDLFRREQLIYLQRSRKEHLCSNIHSLKYKYNDTHIFHASVIFFGNLFLNSKTLIDVETYVHNGSQLSKNIRKYYILLRYIQPGRSCYGINCTFRRMIYMSATL